MEVVVYFNEVITQIKFQPLFFRMNIRTEHILS